MKVAYIGRHVATPEQAEMAANAGIELIPVGDRNGFTFDPHEFERYDGICCAHAAIAMKCLPVVRFVILFENEKRPMEGGAPSFKPKAIHFFSANTTAKDDCDSLCQAVASVFHNDKEYRP